MIFQPLRDFLDSYLPMLGIPGSDTLIYVKGKEVFRYQSGPLDESESGELKSWLKAQHSKNEDHGIRSHHFMGTRWGNSGNSVRLYFGRLQNHCRWRLQP